MDEEQVPRPKNNKYQSTIVKKKNTRNIPLRCQERGLLLDWSRYVKK